MPANRHFWPPQTRARPKIADYPFTTLHPHLGVAHVGGEEFVIADIPGLIEGAHEGTGLGDRFLGHVERCRVLLHLIDGTQDDIALAYQTVRRELEAYGQGLADKPEIVALNKIDALSQERTDGQRRVLEQAVGSKVLTISGVSGSGMADSLRALAERITEARKTRLDSVASAGFVP